MKMLETFTLASALLLLVGVVVVAAWDLHLAVFLVVVGVSLTYVGAALVVAVVLWLGLRFRSVGVTIRKFGALSACRAMIDFHGSSILSARTMPALPLAMQVAVARCVGWSLFEISLSVCLSVCLSSVCLLSVCSQVGRPRPPLATPPGDAPSDPVCDNMSKF